MAIVVVGGSGRNVGKTSLVCGLIAALPEFAWTAVKITSHAHGTPKPIWEEFEAGNGTDTARYLAAGARRAFLLTATEAELPVLLQELGEKLETPRHLIFESNRIVEYVKPDLCLAVEEAKERDPKPSFGRFVHHIDAMVMRVDRDQLIAGAKPRIGLADLARISMEMQQWLRMRLKRNGSA